MHGIPYDPERLKHVLDTMLAAHGARVLTGCVLSSVAVADGVVSAIVVETASGRAAILPRMVVDASGDAEVVARAGGAFAIAPDEEVQSPSAMFSMAPVDMAAFSAVPRPEVNRLLETSGLPLPRTMIAAFPYLAPGQVHLNATRVRKADGRAFAWTQFNPAAED